MKGYWKAAALLTLGALGYRRWQDAARQSQFSGQTVLITGGTRGLGLCLARELVGRGARVAICARDPHELDSAAAELRSLAGGEVFAVACDVSDQQQAAGVVLRVRRALGPIDLLINNAGSIVVGAVDDMGLDEFRHCMDVMFWGTVYTTLAALPELLARKGSVMNITSIGGRVTIPHLVPYCCAKSAALAFSEGLRAEMGPRGLRVLTAVPGLMRTGAHQNALFKGQQAKEYSWFSLAANAPGVAMDPARAARQLLAALARGEAEYHVTLAAEILAHGHGLMPGMVTDLAGQVAAQVLPEASGESTPTIEGEQLRGQIPSWVAQLGDAAVQAHQRHKHSGVNYQEVGR